MYRKIINITVFVVLMAIAAPLSLDAYNTVAPPLRSEMSPPHLIAPPPVKEKAVTENTASFVAKLSSQYKTRMLRVLNHNSVMSGNSKNNALSRSVSASIDAKAAVLLSKAALAKTPVELAKIKLEAEMAFPVASAGSC
mgnify:CR=1 FL=1